MKVTNSCDDIFKTNERKTRSSDFYTSMVAEAIRQSEIEAKKEQQKQNRKESKKGEIYFEEIYFH